MFHFVPNLKQYTYYRGRGNRRFGAYLLSTDYAGSRRGLASKVTRSGRLLVADNGNVDLIRGLIDTHKAEAADLTKRREQEENTQGVRYVRPGKLSLGLTDDCRKFARRMVVASEAAFDDAHVRQIVTAQHGLDASLAIGMEDFAVVCMTALSIEPEYAMLDDGFYEERAQRAVKFALDTAKGVYGPRPKAVFAGMHAIDYDSARIAGRVAGEANVAGIATGLVGALRDKNYVDFRVEGGVVHEFVKAVPRPYVRTIEIVSGLIDGFRERAGKQPPFHALGAGSPILMPLLGLLGAPSYYFGTDSTAPIVDAWTSPTTCLYADSPAPLKLPAYRIAEVWLQGGPGWTCHCPYCRKFSKKHPPDITSARNWWKAQGSPKLTKNSLYKGQPLSKWLPLLANSTNEDLQREAAMARVGHNHWVLMRLERQVRKRQTSPSQLRDYVAEVVQGYIDSAASSSWKAATSEAWKIADAHSRRWPALD